MSKFEIDGIDTDETDDSDEALLVGITRGRNGNDRIGSVGVHVDPETLKAYTAYLRDWRDRMATFYPIQSEIMGVTRRMPGEK